MLNQLRCMHGEVERRLDELARLVHPSVPARTEVAAARLALAKACSRRRVLLQTLIFPNLRGLTAAEVDEVKLVERRCAEVVQLVSQHNALWTLDAAMEDWPGFGRASAEMRRIVAGQIALERRLLYPILERKGDRCDRVGHQSLGITATR